MHQGTVVVLNRRPLVSQADLAEADRLMLAIDQMKRDRLRRLRDEQLALERAALTEANACAARASDLDDELRMLEGGGR